MSRLPIISLFFLLSISVSAQTDSLHTLNGTWNLKMFKNLINGRTKDTASLQDNMVAFYKNVRLTFHDSAGQGTFVGKSFCNNVGGSYLLSDKNKIKGMGISGTKAGCLFEGELWDGMNYASSYRRTKDSLFILYNRDSEEMVFVKCK